ncbi:uncharacterized protein LOC125240088 [Leguminivora glycinivorella]|uniref:uncharacterized protein LOC125240088 n=1 Tax=Leguminivora glycinivorella TaxID=1035111 RepID=UPI00200D19CA|nr:uncharacterized protein LOC125240088 [Leguminivora glycinivorella]
MPYLRRGKTEIYGEMLRDCFEIDLTLLGDEECGICEVCVGRLQDASDFKLQVQRSQARLQAWQEVPCVKDEVSIVKSEESGEHAKPHIVSKIEVEFDDNEQETYFTKKKQLGKEEVLTKEATSQPCPAPPPATVQQEPRTQPYTCDTCRKQFAKKLNLMNHMKVHNKGKIYFV